MAGVSSRRRDSSNTIMESSGPVRVLSSSPLPGQIHEEETDLSGNAIPSAPSLPTTDTDALLTCTQPADVPPPPYPGITPSASANHGQSTTRNRLMNNFRRNVRRAVHFNITDIPTIPFSTDNAGTTDRSIVQDSMYVKEMDRSLQYLLCCLLLCNPLSLILTIPRLICAWNSVKLSMNQEFESAKKLVKLSRIMHAFVFVQFVLVVLIGLIIIFIYLLIEFDQIRVRGTHY